MADPKDCRDRAYRCAVLGSRTNEPRLKDILFKIAGNWLKLAAELERTHALLDDEAFATTVPDARYYQIRAEAWHKKALSATTRGERARFLKLKQAALALARKVATKQQS